VRYLRLSPEERVKLWKEGKDVTGDGLALTYMERALVALGTDAVPYLVEVVKTGNAYYRVYALKILCDMDRFVRKEDMPLPDTPCEIWVEPLNYAGLLNPFMLVDGRRIGREGYEVVKWAAEQTEQKDLRFPARLHSGLLEQDMRALAVDELVAKWRAAVIQSKGLLGGDTDAYALSSILGKILVEKAPDSIPSLIRVLDGDNSGYVREDAINIIQLIEASRMRLRGTELGLKAVESVHRALRRGDLKPVYTKPERRDELWREFSARVFHDEFPLTELTVAAVGLEKLYGVKLTTSRRVPIGATLIEASAEMRTFASYLTKADPSYPSWEYSYTGDVLWAPVMHPRFKQKIARYYQQWKHFKAERGSVSVSRRLEKR